MYLKELKENGTLDRKLIVTMIQSITIGQKIHIAYRFASMFGEDGQQAQEEVKANG